MSNNIGIMSFNNVPDDDDVIVHIFKNGQPYTPDVEPDTPVIGKASQYKEFTPETTATSNNKLEIQLQPPVSAAWLLLVWVKEKPAPYENSIALAATANAGFSGSNFGSLLRADGTIGSDTSEINFNATTGVLKVGGNYAEFPAGLTYCALLIEG